MGLLTVFNRLFLYVFAAGAGVLLAQSGGSGAIGGIVTDPAGGLIPAAQVKVINQGTGEVRLAESAGGGTFLVPLLPPGLYNVEVTKAGFKLSSFKAVRVLVTETATLAARLEVGAVSEQVTVNAAGEVLQTESAALGQVTTAELVSGLPLASRNFAQIIGLNAGVAAELIDATALGRGINPARGIVAQGSPGNDNNFQMDGLSSNDFQSSISSGGIAIPNPDTIEEFKVQTSHYDAANGRNAGANVNLVTKSGTNQFHAMIFEYFRNEKLNANAFFRNQAGQPRPILRQNQPGITLGGPIIKDKLLAFGSYQRTQQANGVGATCSSNFRTPPLTDDRSRAALGRLFGGQRGVAQIQAGNVGPAVAPDGSNIATQAFNLLNLKFPNGQYVFPTPQRIDTTQPFAVQGISSISDPCTFSENQYLANADYYHSASSKVAFRYFTASSDQVTTLPATSIGGATAPGFPSVNPQQFHNASITYTKTVSARMVNEFQIGFHRQLGLQLQTTPVKFSDFGAIAPSFSNSTPQIQITGAVTLGGNGQSVGYSQDTYELRDSLFYTLGKHTLRLGGSAARTRSAVLDFAYYGGLTFQSFADFLLGLNAQQAGTAAAGVLTGNVFQSVDQPGRFDRDWRIWNTSLFVQDDMKLTRRLTVNVGLRFERLGNGADMSGNTANFFLKDLNKTPPAAGSYAGYVVANNFKGTLPEGVQRLDTNTGFLDRGLNAFNPRVGFAWQLPKSDRVVLRGGFGSFRSQIVGQTLLQLISTPPNAFLSNISGSANGGRSWASPFRDPIPLPQFVPYSLTNVLGFQIIDHDFRPPTTYRWSMGLQTKLPFTSVLEVTYVGSRSLSLTQARYVGQAELASPTNPIRGATTNTVANVTQRVRYQGFNSTSFRNLESDGRANYHALEATYLKRFGHGLQLQAAYTWSKFLSDLLNVTVGNNGSAVRGDNYNRRQHYGQDNVYRDQRFVLSGLYHIPGLANKTSVPGRVLNGWQVSSVATLQSGQWLPLTFTNSNSAYGITVDRADIVPGCTYSQLVTPGAPRDRINGYVNRACVAAPRVIGSDGRATDFGNSGIGILRGPGQTNLDLAIVRQFPLSFLKEGARLDFRSEFFNVFNHANFGTPNTALDSAAFGRITTTIVNPRLVQFAVKISF